MTLIDSRLNVFPWRLAAMGRQRGWGAGHCGLKLRSVPSDRPSASLCPLWPAPHRLCGCAGGRRAYRVLANLHSGASRDEGVPVAAGIRKPKFGPFRAGRCFSPQRPARPRPCRFNISWAARQIRASH